jgi:hypothetical protein
MLTWVRCTVAHRRMHRRRDVFFLRRTKPERLHGKEIAP